MLNKRTLAMTLLLTAMAVCAGRAADRPNVLFLFTDDQRADTIAALGNAHIRTPNLDRLVSSGMVFSRNYYMGGWHGAVCAPSRAMLMTGRGLYHVKENLEGSTTWPEQFGRAGYATFITGKWHNQAPGLLRSFNEGHAVFLGGMGNPYKLPVADFAPGPNHKLVNKHDSGTHSIELFANSAIEFIERQKADRPFLCYVAFNAPHDPRMPPESYQGPYHANCPPLPPNFLPLHPFNNGDLVDRDESLAPWPRTEENTRSQLADYYAYITFVDVQIGRILDALENSGKSQNTIIVFTADNGLAIGSHGLFGKQNLYDHSTHLPLIIAGPGIPKGKHTPAFSYLMDLFPTLGDYCGVSAPEGSEGLSLRGVLEGRQEKVRDSIYTSYRHLQRAVRDDRYHLIVYTQINKTQLFDLQNDPNEMHDLAGDPAHAGDVERLTKLLQDWQRRMDDKQPLTKDKPDPIEFKYPRK